MNSALADVHRRLQGPWGRFVPPPAYSVYPVQNVLPHAPLGPPMMWTPFLYTSQGNSTQATFPAVKAIPPSTWTTLDQPGTPFFALPNTNTPVQLQNSWQNSPLAQATVQPTSGWVQTDAIPHILKNIPQTPSSSLHTPSSYASDSSPFHTQNQFPPSQSQRPCGHNFNPGSQSSTSPNNSLVLQLITGSLSFGRLKWDIRQHPAAARSGDSAYSSFPNLDLPALPSGVVSAEIDFENKRMRHFADIWGSIPVQKRTNHYDMTRGISNPISIRDILEDIYQYFMLPLDDQERAQFMSTPRRHEEISAAFDARSEVQSFKYDFYRRADLLPNGLSNFFHIEFIGSGINSCSLGLRLY
jgi:hypothetical protein